MWHIYAHNGILFNLKKEANPDTWMYFEDILLSEINES
jgi:hypothetical protein